MPLLQWSVSHSLRGVTITCLSQKQVLPEQVAPVFSEEAHLHQPHQPCGQEKWHLWSSYLPWCFLAFEGCVFTGVQMRWVTEALATPAQDEKDIAIEYSRGSHGTSFGNRFLGDVSSIR